MSDPTAFNDPKGGDGSSSKPKKKGLASSATVSLSFPAPTADPTPHLAPFRNEHSTYAVVAKSCLQLTYFAGGGSSVQIEDSSTVASSALFHDTSYANIVSSSFAALVECIQNHTDRRARILSIKTLAVVARSAYARIRPSPLIFAMRDATVNRLEDEVGNEIPTVLVTAALEDADSGVSAAAVEALGHMTLSSSSTPGSIVEDELIREIQSIAFCSVAPYAPSLRAVADEDPSIPQAELQARIYENIIGPRLLHLVDRLTRYELTLQLTTALPVVTACLVHQVKTTPATVFGMDRPTFAKRWLELDAVGLVETVISSCILPAMQSCVDTSLAHCAALSGLRLANACPQAQWVPTVSRWAAAVLREEATGQPLETKLASLAAAVIALRALPFPERTTALIELAQDVGNLPSTSVAPYGVTSPGVLMESYGSKVYRRPARVGLWTEIALSFFMDGPDDEYVPRGEYLKQFFVSPPFAKLMAEADKPGIPLCRNELLLVFCTVAVDTGRRFRVAADGSLHVTDPNAPEVGDWLGLAWAVLTTFVSCVHAGPKTIYMAEDMSLSTAGLASYVKLVQEYLHFVGLLDPAASVSLKLTSNACPPHLLWDQLAESASFLGKFETLDLGDLESTTRLMDELVAREVKTGIRSHHMRLFVLTLAADHWVQGRVVGIRKQFEAATSTAAGTLTLNMQSGREIVLALSPKRLLAKIFEAHVPPLEIEGMKKKKDPIKKLAIETVRAAVASIENIALAACDWRRRFGSGQESKQLVSIAVGILQGKGDNTPEDDNMKLVMGPLCDAAVGRIQAFYESGPGTGLDEPFPASSLVTPPVKTKIKPLVSSSKPLPVKPDEYLAAFLMQLSRQIISSRVEQSVESFPSANSLLSPARPKAWHRLSVPPIPESRDARKYGSFGSPLSAWGNNVVASSASSDATTIVLAYSPRRCLRYDGEEEFRTAVLMRVYNITAIEFTEGLRLQLGVVQRGNGLSEAEDATSSEILESLGGQLSDVIGSKPLVSSEVVFKQEFKAGECVTWEIGLDSVPVGYNIALMPSVVYRNIEAEADEVGAKWVGDKPAGGGDASTTGGESNGEDGFQVTTDKGSKAGAEKETCNVCVPGDPLVLSPLSGLQPCPLVFFRDSWGDVDTFRFFWFRMAYQLSPIRIAVAPGATSSKSITEQIATMASLTWEGEAIPGGFASRIWAFNSLGGQRVLAVLAESDNGEEDGTKPMALYLRSDDRSLLFALVGSKAARAAVVAALLPGMAAAS